MFFNWLESRTPRQIHVPRNLFRLWNARVGEETKVVVHVGNINHVAAAWLRYSLNDSAPMIMRMQIEGETLIGNLGVLGNGTHIAYEVCLQDNFLNTGWSNSQEATVIPEFSLVTLLPLLGYSF